MFGKAQKDGELKYLYIEPTNRSKVLYGLNHTYDAIQRAHKVYVGEAEKSVMQLWSMGMCNAVATGGKRVSRQQIDMLTRLCVDVVFLLIKMCREKSLIHWRGDLLMRYTCMLLLTP